MNIINRKDQTEEATWKEERGREEDVGKTQEHDERTRGGRHMHGDAKGDTRRETDAETEKRKRLFLPVLGSEKGGM